MNTFFFQDLTFLYPFFLAVKNLYKYFQQLTDQAISNTIVMKAIVQYYPVPAELSIKNNMWICNEARILLRFDR